MSVGQGGDIELQKSSGETFLALIGAEGGQSRSLYKTYWLSWRVNFLDMGDGLKKTGLIHALRTLSEF